MSRISAPVSAKKPATHWIIFTCITCLVILLAFSIYAGRLFALHTGLSARDLWQMVRDESSILSQAAGHTNVLVMGIGGGAHEGSDLTDTMMIVSIDHHRKKLSLVSIPRDLWSDALADKINSAYHYGQLEKPKRGLQRAKENIQTIVGFPIQYAVVIDFAGFTSLINLVGGVDVDVPLGFTDSMYPIATRENDTCAGDPTFSCRYKIVTFMPGVQHMDGDRALIYVRSRHASDNEGTDFARGKRQQEVIAALIKKMTSLNTWLENPTRITTVPKILDLATDTDLRAGETIMFSRVMYAYRNNQTRIAFEDLLTVPDAKQYADRYVLVPRQGFPALHAYLRTVLQIQ